MPVWTVQGTGHTHVGHGNLSSLFDCYWSVCFTTKEMFEYTQKIVKMKGELVSETGLKELGLADYPKGQSSLWL